MNMVKYQYRVWQAKFPDCTITYRLKQPRLEGWVRESFRVPSHVKLAPKIDRRMKNWGRSLLH